MKYYILNSLAQPNGDHEVHNATCTYLPELKNQISLGYCHDDFEALMKARQCFAKADGCAFCCPGIHRS